MRKVHIDTRCMVVLQPRKALPTLNVVLQGGTAGAMAAATITASANSLGVAGRVFSDGSDSDEREADGVGGNYAALEDVEGPATPVASPIDRRLRCAHEKAWQSDSSHCSLVREKSQYRDTKEAQCRRHSI